MCSGIESLEAVMGKAKEADLIERYKAASMKPNVADVVKSDVDLYRV